MPAQFLLLKCRPKINGQKSRDRKVLIQTSFIKTVEDIGRKEREGSRIIYKDGGEIKTYDVMEPIETIATLLHAQSADNVLTSGPEENVY